MAGTGMRLAVAALVAAGTAVGVARAREDKDDLRQKLKDEAIVGDWNYDDIDGAFARAAREKKPVCIVFR